jgi:hypothetical protein
VVSFSYGATCHNIGTGNVLCRDQYFVFFSLYDTQDSVSVMAACDNVHFKNMNQISKNSYSPLTKLIFVRLIGILFSRV